jgi:hypothetical protein
LLRCTTHDLGWQVGGFCHYRSASEKEAQIRPAAK